MDSESNKEIAEALKEFESKPYNIRPEQTPENSTAIAPSPEPEIPKLTSWVMKYSGGAVENRRQAEYVLLGFAILAVLISALLIFLSGSNPSPLPPEDIAQEGQIAG